MKTERLNLGSGYFAERPLEGSLVQRRSEAWVLYGPDNKPISYLVRNDKKLRAFAQAMQKAQLEGARKMQEAAILVCEDEQLEEPNPKSDSDEAYDRGVFDGADAIRALDPAKVVGEGK